MKGSRSIRVAGHFGEFLQGRIGPDGPVALISLPCPVLTCRAEWSPAPDFTLHSPSPIALSRRDAARLIRSLGLVPRGRLILRPDMPAGGGAGGSTAARVAIARLLRPDIDPLALARLCLKTEGATDPLMFHDFGRLLWASRAARVLARMPALPRMQIVGGFFGAPRRTDPGDLRFADIADLVAEWPDACASVGGVAQIVSDSARRTLALRGPSGDPTEDLARELGAAGWAIAHTGSARALIFSPDAETTTARSALGEAGFGQVIRYSIGARPC